MNQRICFNFASRSRPEKFYACLDNIRALVSQPHNYFVLAKIDVNDKRYAEYTSRLHEYREVVPVFGNSRNKVDAINRGLQGRVFDILCNHSDDMWFVEKGFDDIIRKAFDRKDLFVHFPDQVAKDRLCTYAIMDYQYYARFGYVYHPSYVSLWCDNEAHEVAKMLRKYKFVPEVILEHRHPSNGHGVMDEQYRRTERFYHIDRITYQRRKAINFGIR